MTQENPIFLTESILDDEELQNSYSNNIDISSLTAGSDDIVSEYEYYANIRYSYMKLYDQETRWWRKEFTAHINVKDIYEDIYHIATVSGLFKSFFIDKKVTMLGYSDRRMTHINSTWEYPDLPEDFDVKAWYEEVEETYPQKVIFGHKKEAIFCIRVYFNFNKQMTHKQFLKHLWKFLPALNVLKHIPDDRMSVSFFRNDENPVERPELALVENPDRLYGSETFSGDYMYTPEKFDELYTALTSRDDYQENSGRSHNYIQERIINRTNFSKLMDYAARQARSEYGFILTPGEFRYPNKNSVYQRDLSNSSSWCAFTVENVDSSKKEIDICDLEECIIKCLLFRMDVNYFGICEFLVALRVIPKLINTRAEQIRQEFIKNNTSEWSKRIPNMTQEDKQFYYFEGSMRPVTSEEIKMSNNQWNERARTITFSGESVTLLLADKNGCLNKKPFEMQWPANAHNYLISIMRSEEIWNNNKEYVISSDKLTESLLDDISSEDIPSGRDVLQNKASEEMQDDISSYEYYIYLRVRYIRPPFDKEPVVNIDCLFDELSDAVEESWIIPNRYYMTYPHMGDSNTGNFDVDIDFIPPLPTEYDLKDFYNSDYYRASPYLDMKIYIDSLRYCTFPRFVREMNKMLGRLHSAIKISLPQSDGELQFYFTDRQNHNGRYVVHSHTIYTSRCYQFGEQYRDIYREMFPEQAKEQQIEYQSKFNDYDNDVARQTIKKMDLRRLGVNIERNAAKYNMDATMVHYYRGIITEDVSVPMSWISIDMNTLTDEKRLDIRDAEQLLIDALFRHLTYDMVTNTNLFVFVRADFEIYNKDFEERKERGDRVIRHSYEADEYKYPGQIMTTTMTYLNNRRQNVIDPRVRLVQRGYTTIGYILFFDKKGRMGRKPFTERPYNFGGNAELQFIEDVVQTGLVWREDFKPETTSEFEENE